KTDVNGTLPFGSPLDFVERAIDELAAEVDVNPDLIGDVDIIDPTGNTAFSQGSKPAGIIGGAQIGFNVQSGVFVFGLEADFQGSGQKDDARRVDAFAATVTGSVGPAAVVGELFGSTETEYTSKIEWFGTVRGRLGVAADNVLFYATGGLAYG